jgi:hypothetical protein
MKARGLRREMNVRKTTMLLKREWAQEPRRSLPMELKRGLMMELKRGLMMELRRESPRELEWASH